MKIVSVIFLMTIYSFSTQASLSCSKKCNVVLISIDSLRRDHLGIYGYKRETSPNIDSLAKKSWLFKNYYSTDYLTPESERSVHTGLFPDRHYSEQFKKNPPLTLGDILKSNGYVNAAFGNSPEFQMIDQFRNLFKSAFGKEFNLPDSRIEKNRQLDWSQINKFTKENKNRPLFLWFALGAVHAPFGYKLPNKFADKNYHGAFYGVHFFANMQYYYDNYVYDPREPGKKFNLVFRDRQSHLIDKLVTGKFPKKVNKNDFKFINDIYDNGVAQADFEVGKIIEILKNNNLFDDTIIILQSEHGETLGERKYIAHTDIYDEMVHMPLIIHLPQSSPLVIKEKFVSGTDILPTVLSMLGIPFTNYPLDGQSIVKEVGKKIEPHIVSEEVHNVRMPLWEVSLAVDQKNSIFDQLRQYQQMSGNDFREYAIKNKNYKLIHRRARFAEMQYSAWTFISGKKLNIPEYEFYDVSKDPKELSSIAAKGPDFEKLKNRLHEFETLVRTNNLKEIPKVQLQDYR